MVFREQSADIHELKLRIRAAFEEISVDVCQRSLVEFDRRIRLCLERNGDHIEQLL